MAYNQNNLSNISPNLTSGSWGMWVYRSADPVATVIAAGYISNATEMGLAVGDTILVIDTATPTQTWSRVTVVTAAGLATLSSGVLIA
jgi:hypothetical protein